MDGSDITIVVGYVKTSSSVVESFGILIKSTHPGVAIMFLQANMTDEAVAELVENNPELLVNLEEKLNFRGGGVLPSQRTITWG